MTCTKAQSLITAFINDELKINELEEFVEHIRSCDECSEELEVYYALLTAMKQLDEDKNLSIDYRQELNDKLDRIEEEIIHLRFNFYRKKGILFLILILLVVLFTIQDYFNLRNIEKPVAESTFRLRMSFMEDRFDDSKELLDRYLNDQEGILP
ncbi:MAG: zf-HC2 domain-containing protein [Clostridiales bacterium]|nr:zf-HC2 domain-containing protein [Clostridiales bacterium]